MADVHAEILIHHIFIRLPVRSLLQCRCVCKQWLGLLSEPQFSRMHFKHQKIYNQQKNKILLGPVYDNKIHLERSVVHGSKLVARYGVFFSVDVEESLSGAVDAVSLPGFQPLKDFYLMRTLGHCNGMVCMKVCRRNYAKEDYLKRWHLLFGNPSTGDYRILPEPIKYGNLFVGFVYDSSVDDFKFVRVHARTRNLHIFSLKLNSWRTVLGSADNYWIEPSCRIEWKGRDIHNVGHNVGFALDGSIYWMVETTNKIVRFDLKDEEFRELSLPRDKLPGNTLSIKVVGALLCAINVCHNNSEVDMWSMLEEEEENNTKEKSCRWIKLMRVTFPSMEFGEYFDMYPLCFMKDGKLLCCVEHSTEENNSYRGAVKHLLIDPKTKRLEDYTIQGISRDWLKNCTFELQHSAYIDSLLSPN